MSSLVIKAVARLPSRAFATAGGGGGGSLVRDVMTTKVDLAYPKESVQAAAQKMKADDTGFLPVASEDGSRLIGMLTDRDLAVRVVAEGKNPASCVVQEAMTRDIKYCFEDETLDHVAQKMAQQQIRRLPVMNREKRLVGVISIGDLAVAGAQAGQALAGVSKHGGQHNQSRMA